MVDWLNHLLYLFDIDGFLGRDFQVASLTTEHLVAGVSGETFDAARHPSRTGVKAATFHQLSIVPEDGLASHGGAGFVKFKVQGSELGVSPSRSQLAGCED